MRLIFALLICWGALPAYARCTGDSIADLLSASQQAEVAAAVAATPYAEGVVFLATRAEQRLVIVGTIHIYDPGLETIRDRVAPEIRTADVLLVEASPQDAAALEAHMAAHPEMMFLTDGPTLPEMLEDAAWERLVVAARDRQIPAFLAAKMQPWFLSLSMAVPPCAMADMLAGHRGLDFMLMEDAEAAGVPIQSLEPWLLVMDMMREGTIEDQLAALELGLLPIDVQRGLFVAMVEYYLAGEVAEIWEISRAMIHHVPGLDPLDGTVAFDETEQRLLIERNRMWMPVIGQAMAGHERGVMAVGAAHLPGEHGVLRLLERAGWGIRRY